ncbi:hypothetical protein BKA93DRAFT_822055 [Sparassis latifolia]
MSSHSAQPQSSRLQQLTIKNQQLQRDILVLHTEKATMMVSYQTLAEAIPQALSVTNPFNLTIFTSSTSTIPSASSSLPPVMQVDYLHVKWWTKESWTKRAVRPEPYKGNNMMLYVEEVDGTPISGARVDEIRKVARSIWAHLASIQLTPLMWGKASVVAARLYNDEIARTFPELQYCASNWKAEQIGIDNYPSWRNYRAHKAAGVKQEEVDPTAVEVSPCKSKHGHRDETENDTQSIAPASKKTKTESSKTALILVTTSEELLRSLDDESDASPSDNTSISIVAEKPGCTSDKGKGRAVELKLRNPLSSITARNIVHSETLYAAAVVPNNVPITTPVSREVGATPSLAATSAPSAPPPSSTQPNVSISLNHPVVTFVDLVSSSSGSTTVPTAQSDEPSDLFSMVAPPTEQSVDLAASAGCNPGDTDSIPAIPEFTMSSHTSNIEAQALLKGPAKRTKHAKMRPGDTVTPRNLCAVTWIKAHPDGTTAKFKQYFDLLLTEERKPFEEESKRLKQTGIARLSVMSSTMSGSAA